MSRLHVPFRAAARASVPTTVGAIARVTAMATLLVVLSACSGSDSTTAPTPTPTPNPGPKPVATIQLNPAVAFIDVGGTQTLAATTRDAHNQVLRGRAISHRVRPQGAVFG